MRNYLSMGFGVNSVATHLLLDEQGIEFESVFVNHGGDWPETYAYADYFVSKGNKVTILKPKVRSRSGREFDNIIDYFEYLKVLPSKSPKRRFCTARFKSAVLDSYQETPCFVFIGYALDESKRAVISSKNGREYRWPLIEAEMTRQDCIDYIKSKGYEVPIKSGCYICPFQKVKDYKELRKKHPELFCRAQKIEAEQNKRITKDGRPWKKYYLAGNAPLIEIERQGVLFEQDEYPPCLCGL